MKRGLFPHLTFQCISALEKQFNSFDICDAILSIQTKFSLDNSLVLKTPSYNVFILQLVC